jgi:hypothetical protein
MGRVPGAATEATMLLELADGPLKPAAAADAALGVTLRAYSFDRYKTKRKEGEETPAKARVTLGVAGGVVLVEVVEHPGEPPGVLVLAEMLREPAHHALDRDQMTKGDVLVDLRAHQRDGGLAIHGCSLSAGCDDSDSPLAPTREKIGP